MIEIKHRFNGSVLYTAENAQDVRTAVEEAAKANADLRSANLGSADLRSANLRSADLGYADLGFDHPLWLFRQDYWSILDQAPGEVAHLRKQIKAGKINGSVYSEDDCGCLNGTIAIHAGCSVEGLEEKFGIVASGSRPAEQWFIAIDKGDKPLPLDTDFSECSEGEFRISLAQAWLDEWLVSRRAIAKALAPKRSKKKAAGK